MPSFNGGKPAYPRVNRVFAKAPNNGIVNPCRTPPDPSLNVAEDNSVATDHTHG